MEYVPPADGVVVAKLSQAYEGAPCFWVPDDDLIFTELYGLMDYESAKGPFGEAFLRLSCYQRCRSALRPNAPINCNEAGHDHKMPLEHKTLFGHIAGLSSTKQICVPANAAINCNEEGHDHKMPLEHKMLLVILQACP